MMGSHSISPLRKSAREYRSAATIEPIRKVSSHATSRLPSAQSHSITEQKDAVSDWLERQAAFSSFVSNEAFVDSQHLMMLVADVKIVSI
jgi:hypothetical protein